MDKFVGIDIGGTSIKYGVIDESGNIVYENSIHSMALTGSEIIRQVIVAVYECLSLYDVKGIGVSAAGIIDTTSGIVVEASDTIKEYKGTKIKASLETEFNLMVHVENDVNCAMLAEAWIGCAKNEENSFLITIGTGVGGAIMIKRKLVSGHNYSAGEIGYLLYNNEPLDISGSTRGLVRRVSKQKQIDESELDGKIVFDLVSENDKICICEVEIMSEAIACAIAQVAYILNPHMIIIGGGIINEKDTLIPMIKKKCEDKIIPFIFDKLLICAAEQGNRAGMIGAVYNFINKMQEG